MDAKPMLLLDIDGVLCPLLEGPTTAWKRVSTGHSGTYSVLVKSDTKQLLKILEEEFDLVWCSSWEEDSQVIGQLFDLPVLPVVSLTAVDTSVRTWKLGSVERFVGDRPFAWIDDEIGRDGLKWAENRSSPTKLLRANPDVGLTRRHVESLLEFAEELSAAA